MSLDFTKAEVDILFTYQKPTERTAELYKLVNDAADDAINMVQAAFNRYHKFLLESDTGFPPKPEQLQPFYKQISLITRDFFGVINRIVPPCELRDQAFARIILARMRSNASFIHNGPNGFATYANDAKLLANAAIAMYDSEDGALTNHRREQQQMNLPFDYDDIPF